ncbi:two-component system sensor histidine kinase RstB [Siccibacter colletis]|uniref:histidine kinase n=1 Tax=Siccibacter colletis TaxID=1505757 RepID=A0ABY6JKL6_9ENTR|nr:two-component system sensor histidine kinase RstB [Siccibacter colletis]UYU33534.1 two-component system sensor histidine kinase RstB [Siccibacter colletis]
MRKLFVQFYLLLFACFLVMTMLVGLVYKFTAERAGRQSLDDLMKSSLYLMRSELDEIPPKDWNKTIGELDLNLSFKLRIEPLNTFTLNAPTMKRLRDGDIIALDKEYTFIQRIPQSNYVLAVGPVPYLFFLHQMRLLDIALIAFIAFSLAVPVFIWMRPHWQEMLKLESAARRLGSGKLDERIHFEPDSSFERMGVAFNQMADNINALIASKKQLIDGIAHELRTPLVRLRYRLAMSDNLSPDEARGLNRDIGQLEGLIDELLTYARLDRPETELTLSRINLTNWLKERIEEIRYIHPEREILLTLPTVAAIASVDVRLMDRVLDNLINNALRYSQQTLSVSLQQDERQWVLAVEDDGPGIPAAERERVFEPFVRLDPSRDRATGGCGLGLAIVRSVAVAMKGQVTAESSRAGGARFRFSWPGDGD